MRRRERRPSPNTTDLSDRVAVELDLGGLAMRVRDELGGVFTDDAFVKAFGVRGRRGSRPGYW